MRPWRDGDIPELIEVYRDPVLRHWSRHPVDDTRDAHRWMTRSRQGWAAGRRFAFAVREPRPGGGDRLVATVVLKDVLPGCAHDGHRHAAPRHGSDRGGAASASPASGCVRGQDATVETGEVAR
ncbi:MULTISPECIES: GNAT family N-acetyltransferase [unclassified Micromonospora]|uniref:GNAT family N-acetyltransferase n=1 Tax=unclassified Micromonospora TaxID=2617518 RepID=UPI00362EC7B7